MNTGRIEITAQQQSHRKLRGSLKDIDVRTWKEMQLTGIERDVRKSQNPEHKKIQSEDGVDQVLG